ncbi:hypothetical protein LINGRAHAP2_LOCUS7656 [Linum grandiflorum]
MTPRPRSNRKAIAFKTPADAFYSGGVDQQQQPEYPPPPQWPGYPLIPDYSQPDGVYYQAFPGYHHYPHFPPPPQ